MRKTWTRKWHPDVPVSIIDAVYGDYTCDGGVGANKWKQACTDKSVQKADCGLRFSILLMIPHGWMQIHSIKTVHGYCV